MIAKGEKTKGKSVLSGVWNEGFVLEAARWGRPSSTDPAIVTCSPDSPATSPAPDTLTAPFGTSFSDIIGTREAQHFNPHIDLCILGVNLGVFIYSNPHYLKHKYLRIIV